MKVITYVYVGNLYELFDQYTNEFHLCFVPAKVCLWDI